MNQKFYVKKSGVSGKGCFASQDIKKGELICRMQGKPMSIPQVIRKYEKGTERYDDSLQIGVKTYLDLDQPFIYFNHSCNANAAIVKTNSMIARRNIKKDEEISYDYSLVEWTDKKSFDDWSYWQMRCRCGALNCRKYVKHFPLLPKNIQKNSVRNGFVQDFIVNNYKKEINRK
ncbi:MAG TPA: SET domain-containing protein-lysine N-methyltransferase [Verrucomicrobiae bacterium]|nr:SET domain-containing protein-lysine N-methyltransferase [Verrucomicrobiae bacterium]